MLHLVNLQTKVVSVVADDHYVKKSIVVIEDHGVVDKVEMTATKDTVGDVVQGIMYDVTNENVIPEEGDKYSTLCNGELLLKESDHDSSNTDLQLCAEAVVISVQIADLPNTNVVLPEVLFPMVTVLFSAGTTIQDNGGAGTPRHDVVVVRTTEFSGVPMSLFCHKNTRYMAPQKETCFIDENDLLKLCTDEKEEDATITFISPSSTSSIVASTTAIPTSYIMLAIELDDFPRSCTIAV